MTIPAGADYRITAIIGRVHVGGRPVSAQMMRIIAAAWADPTEPFRLTELIRLHRARCSAIHAAYRPKTRRRRP